MSLQRTSCIAWRSVSRYDSISAQSNKAGLRVEGDASTPSAQGSVDTQQFTKSRCYLGSGQSHQLDSFCFLTISQHKFL